MAGHRLEKRVPLDHTFYAVNVVDRRPRDLLGRHELRRRLLRCREPGEEGDLEAARMQRSDALDAACHPRGNNHAGMRALLWPHLRPQRGALLAALLLGAGDRGSVGGAAAAHAHGDRSRSDRPTVPACWSAPAPACSASRSPGSCWAALHRAIYVRASGRALFSLRGAVYAHLLRVSPRRLAQVPVGDLVSRLDGDIAEVQRFGTDAAASFIGSLLSLARGGGRDAEPLVAADAGAWRRCCRCSLLVRHYARPRIETSTRAACARRRAALSGFLVETLSGARSVQAAAAEEFEEPTARRPRRRLSRSGAAAAAGELYHGLLAGFWASRDRRHLRARRLVRPAGPLSVGTLVAFVAYLGRSAGSAASIASLYTGYQRARVSLERVEELLGLPQVPEAGDAIAIPADARGALRLEAGERVAASGVRPFSIR